jgi:hypothetical protein
MPRKNKSIPHQPYQHNNMCEDKRRYISEKDALEVAAYQMLLKPSLELGVYKCPYCGGWHLTNIGKK